MPIDSYECLLHVTHPIVVYPSADDLVKFRYPVVHTDSVGVIVLFKNEGKNVGGNLTYIDNLNAGQEKAFEISGYDVPEHDAYEVSAINWGF